MQYSLFYLLYWKFQVETCLDRLAAILLVDYTSTVSFISYFSARSKARKMSLETVRFADENDYEYEIWFKVFSPIVKK